MNFEVFALGCRPELSWAFDLLLYTALASECVKVQALGLQILPRVMLFSQHQRPRPTPRRCTYKA